MPGPASVSDGAEASAEPINRAPGLGRPESRDEALCHPAPCWGAAPPRRWVWPQPQSGGIGNSHSSEVEDEGRIRGVRNKWAGNISQVHGRQAGLESRDPGTGVKDAPAGCGTLGEGLYLE